MSRAGPPLFNESTSHLRIADFPVFAAAFHQLFMAAQADDPALLEYENYVAVLNRADALRDGDNGRALHLFRKRAAQAGVGLVIERGRAVVQHEDFRPRRQGARDEDALLLAAGNVGALLREQVAVALGERGDEVVGLRGLGRFDDLFVRQRAAEANVFFNRIGIQEIVLHRRAEHGGKRFARDGADVPSVDAHAAGAYVVEALQQPHDSGFAAAGGADDAERAAARHREADVGQVVAGALIGKAHAVEHDVRIRFGVRERLFALQRHILADSQHLADAFGRRGALGLHHENTRDRHHRHRNEREILHERNHRLRVGKVVGHARRTQRHDGHDADVHQQRHHGVDDAHNRAGAFFVPDKDLVCGVVAAVFVIVFGERLDDADALHVLADDADHFIHRALDLGIERHALFGNKIDRDENEREDGKHRQRQIAVHQQRDGDAADEQHRRADAHPQHHTDEAVYVIGVGRDARLERGQRDGVGLRGGDADGFVE